MKPRFMKMRIIPTQQYYGIMIGCGDKDRDYEFFNKNEFFELTNPCDKESFMGAMSLTTNAKIIVDTYTKESKTFDVLKEAGLIYLANPKDLDSFVHELRHLIDEVMAMICPKHEMEFAAYLTEYLFSETMKFINQKS